MGIAADIGRLVVRWVLRVGTAVAVIVVVATLALMAPFFPEGRRMVVASKDTADMELVVVQVANSAFDGFAVSLYGRRAGETSWRKYFVDHDSGFLYFGSVEADGDAVRVRANGTTLATLQWNKDQIVLASGRVVLGHQMAASPW